MANTGLQTHVSPTLPKQIPGKIAEMETEEILYPASDGEPMGETDTHINQIIILKSCLALYYQDRKDVSVSADILLYYKEGDPTQRVSPDVMVTLGVPKQERRSFFVWKEGKAPDVVFEIASEKSLLYDTITKLYLYQKLGVKEYFVFNPLAEPLKLNNALVGYRLQEDTYQLMQEEGEKVVSEVLQLELAIHDNYLRLRYPDSQEWIPTLEEAYQKAKEETRARELAEQKAKEETRARELAEQKAKEETRARELAEQRIQELEQKLKKNRQQK